MHNLISSVCVCTYESICVCVYTYVLCIHIYIYIIYWDIHTCVCVFFWLWGFCLHVDIRTRFLHNIGHLDFWDDGGISHRHVLPTSFQACIQYDWPCFIEHELIIAVIESPPFITYITFFVLFVCCYMLPNDADDLPIDIKISSLFSAENSWDFSVCHSYCRRASTTFAKP